MTSTNPSPSSLIRRRRHVVELPESDPIIDAMPSALRQEVAKTWERRAHEELKVAAAFSVLTRELLETRGDPMVLAGISRGVNDEVRHAEVCRSLAGKYRGAEVPWPAEVIIEPSTRADDRRLRTAFHVVSMCCVNEAIASSYLDASLAGAKSPSARIAVGELLADEVEHARIGWVLLARSPSSLRAAIESNLVTLVRPVWQCWWDGTQVTLRDGAPEHGLPSVATTRSCATAALRDIVAPGFAELGFDVGPLLEWVAERPLSTRSHQPRSSTSL
jgi:hypothetical protein